MIRGYDPRESVIRGLGVNPVRIERRGQSKTLSPYYWAAFQLSGDWR